MKKINLTVVVTILILLGLSGCAQKAPSLGNTNNSSTQTHSLVGGNTIDVKDGEASGTLGRTPNGASEMNSGSVYNSSSDGFMSIYFDLNAYDVTNDMLNRNETNVANFKKKPTKIKIEGNCDESGTDEYNYALGLKRAKAIQDAMVLKGVPQSDISIVSLGESTPICSDGSEECNMRNRRVDIRKVK